MRFFLLSKCFSLLFIAFFYNFLQPTWVNSITYKMIIQRLIHKLDNHSLFGYLFFLSSGRKSFASQSIIRNLYRSSDVRPSICGIDLTLTSLQLSIYKRTVKMTRLLLYIPFSSLEGNQL